ncbi:hypothetical protein [Paenibacillus sp. Soil750]|uniref:hypothetical protein n=1 Tax=Paenibacillus sp. Soil750 TaxID=1736398 RepID=UPI000B01A2E5|nr:hypothetical protein [Paenibacillus sp. Soil750]
MSVNSPKSSKIIYELDIVKVAEALGLDQARLLAYVYNRSEAIHAYVLDEPAAPSDAS